MLIHRSENEPAITVVEWRAYVDKEATLEHLPDVNGLDAMTLHVPSSSRLEFYEGRIGYEYVDSDNAKIFQKIATDLKAGIYEYERLIKPEWYDLEWWDEDTLGDLRWAESFEEQFGRKHRSEAELMRFIGIECEKATRQMDPEGKLGLYQVNPASILDRFKLWLAKWF